MSISDFAVLGLVGMLLIVLAVTWDWRESRVRFPEYRFPR